MRWTGGSEHDDLSAECRDDLDQPPGPISPAQQQKKGLSTHEAAVCVYGEGSDDALDRALSARWEAEVEGERGDEVEVGIEDEDGVSCGVELNHKPQRRVSEDSVQAGEGETRG